MSDAIKVRSVVAKFFNVAESEVDSSFAFPRERLQGSVARSALHAALKRMAGADLQTAFTANTYGELIAASDAKNGSSLDGVGPPDTQAGRLAMLSKAESAKDD